MNPSSRKGQGSSPTATTNNSDNTDDEEYDVDLCVLGTTSRGSHISCSNPNARSTLTASSRQVSGYTHPPPPSVTSPSLLLLDVGNEKYAEQRPDQDHDSLPMANGVLLLLPMEDETASVTLQAGAFILPHPPPSGINSKTTLHSLIGPQHYPPQPPGRNHVPTVSWARSYSLASRSSSRSAISKQSLERDPDVAKAPPAPSGDSQPKRHGDRKRDQAQERLRQQLIRTGGLVLVVLIVAVATVVGVLFATDDRDNDTVPASAPSTQLGLVGVPSPSSSSGSSSSSALTDSRYNSPTSPETRMIQSETKLTASDGAADAWFGCSVAIDQNTLVVGARLDDTRQGVDSGSAYIYTRAATTTSWTLVSKLMAGTASAAFGFSVAVEGDTIVIGAENEDHDNGSGSAYVYIYSEGIWTQQAKLMPNYGAVGTRFSGSVAISGDTIVIGANWENTENGFHSGSAFVYSRILGVWTQQASLTARNGVAHDVFGSSVAIDGNTIIIGASDGDTENGPDTGSVYVFIISEGVWTQQANLKASDGSTGDKFGSSVSIYGDTIVVGAHMHDTAAGQGSGSAYVYNGAGGVWTQQAKLTASDDATGNSYFGWSVALDQDAVVVGAWGHDTENTSDCGSVYVYSHSGGDWTQLAKLTASDGTDGDWFGHSVAMSVGTVVVGAEFADTNNGKNSGAVYTFV